MSTETQTSPQTEEENDVTRTVTAEVCLGQHWLQLYDDGYAEIIDERNYLTGNEHGEELVQLKPAELALLKAHLCS